MTVEQMAELARSLRDNDAFNHILDRIRTAALDDLCAVEPTDTETIRTLQARVHVVDQFRFDLSGLIRAQEVSQRRPGVA